MTIRITADDLAAWIEESDGATSDSVEWLRMEMTDDDKAAVDAIIARRQIEEDASAQVVDSAIVLDVLKDHGFHPAFEYGGLVSGQAAYESMRSASHSLRP